MSERPVEQLSYEQARDELVEVVRSLETGSAALEDSLKLWERGEALAAHCQAFLDGARERLNAATHHIAADTPGRDTPRATPPPGVNPTEAPEVSADSNNLTAESPECPFELQ